MNQVLRFLRTCPIIETRHLPDGESPNGLRVLVSIVACLVAIWAIGLGIAIVAMSGVLWGVDNFLNIIKPEHSETAHHTTEHLTRLGVAIARLTNLGIFVLAVNTLLEIALLVNEPGVAHVRRVLALSFTGMAIFLIKEYPLRERGVDFLFGCLSGGIAGAMWLMYPVGKPDDRERRPLEPGADG